jgi:phage shock protein A
MQEAVQQLTESVAQITGSYQKAQRKLKSKQQELEQIEPRALVAKQRGNEPAARLAMGKPHGKTPSGPGKPHPRRGNFLWSRPI